MRFKIFKNIFFVFFLFAGLSCTKDLPRDNPRDINSPNFVPRKSLVYSNVQLLERGVVPNIIYAGDTVSIQFTITNNGNIPLYGLTVNCTSTLASNNIWFNYNNAIISELDTGQSIIVTGITFSTNPNLYASTFPFTICVSDFNNTEWNNTVNLSLVKRPPPPAPKLSFISVSSDYAPFAGSYIDLTVTIRNFYSTDYSGDEFEFAVSSDNLYAECTNNCDAFETGVLGPYSSYKAQYTTYLDPSLPSGTVINHSLTVTDHKTGGSKTFNYSFTIE